METHIDTSPRMSETELPQEVVNKHFTEMAALYELEKEIEQRKREQLSVVELENTRHDMLNQLLEKNPHEAIAEIVHSLALLYEDRTDEYREDDATVRVFATRDATNQQLDDYFMIRNYDNGEVGIEVRRLKSRRAQSADDNARQPAMFRDGDVGIAITIGNDDVRTHDVRGKYKVPITLSRTDGLNKHQKVLYELSSHMLATAGFVLERLENNPLLAAEANQQAKEMLAAEVRKSS